MNLRIFVICFLSSASLYAQQFAPRYELVKLNKEVNTHYHEAAPVLSQDGKKLYFFVHNHPQNSFGKEGSDDIWMSTLNEKGEWGAPEHLGAPYNAHRSNQVFTTLSDGSLFVKGGRRKETKGFSLISGSGGVTEIEIPGFDEMNKGRFYGASISVDLKHIVLFFSETPTSTRSSLYISNAQTDGKWSRPAKLNISVKDDDCGPFLAADGETLYFASDRNVPGKRGKLDIYRTKRLDATWQKWSQPENMGPSINTAAEELYFCIDNQNNVFTSRANSTIDGGNLDLYKLVPRDVLITLAGNVYNKKTGDPVAATVTVQLDDKKEVLKTRADGVFKKNLQELAMYTLITSADNFLPDQQDLLVPTANNDTTISLDIYLTPIAKKLLVMGTVFDKKTEQPINARVEVQQKNKRSVFFKSNTEGGKYQQELPALSWYMITASTEGYLNATDSVEADSEDNTPLFKDLFLAPIEVGLTVRLKNIYFDFDKTTLKKESFVELNKVVDFLKQNSTVEIEISGHTDSKGSDDYNLNLSQGRSQSVVDYIISQGIDSFRLTAHGYGETKPIDTNDTDAGRANNRRVEFTVIKK
jgi:OmpA-OmpF porin, OOP family